jgi:hypothetical protein
MKTMGTLTTAAWGQFEETLILIIAEVEGALFELVAQLEGLVDVLDEGYSFLEAGAIAEALGWTR